MQLLLALLMAVNVDNTGQSAGGVSVSSITISAFAVGAGSNRCIYLGVSQWKASDTAPTAVFNGTESFVLHDAVTVAEGAGIRRVTILKLVNPTVTTANLVISWASAVDEAVCGADSWQNVDQTTPFGTAVKNSGTGQSSSLSLAGAVGDVNHDAISADANTTPVGTPNQTQRWRAIAASVTTEGGGQTSSGTGGSVTHTWSTLGLDATTIFAHIGVAIRQAQGGGSGPLGALGRTSSYMGSRMGLR